MQPRCQQPRAAYRARELRVGVGTVEVFQVTGAKVQQPRQRHRLAALQQVEEPPVVVGGGGWGRGWAVGRAAARAGGSRDALRIDAAAPARVGRGALQHSAVGGENTARRETPVRKRSCAHLEVAVDGLFFGPAALTGGQVAVAPSLAAGLRAAGFAAAVDGARHDALQVGARVGHAHLDRAAVRVRRVCHRGRAGRRCG